MNWKDALEQGKKDQEKFIRRGKKIVKRFRDERSATESGNDVIEKRYNILWSNVRTLFPAIYSKKPRAQVERRYKDADPVGRTASQILERALQYEIDHYPDYDAALRGCVLDRLLPGRGVAWIRFEAGDQITDDVSGEDEDDEAGETAIISPPKPLASAGMLASLLGPAPAPKTDPEDYECTPCDYVYWEDFRHSPARTWEEVTWVSRRVYMAREEGIERFGERFKEAPLVHEPIGLNEDITVTDDMKKAIVWEIWNKPTKEVIWIAEGLQEPLDTKPDTLNLDGFFPCPKPLFATLTTDTLIPVPDYAEYQDQARELDDLTMRISRLVKAVKAVGVYDASQQSIQRLMQEGVDNTLIPVEGWAQFSQAGGLKGTVELLPMDMIVATLNELYKARDVCKQVIYEVTGLSDIIRGASEASETATAQQIKSQYASLRLKEMTQDVARFASDLLSMKAQVMSDLYRPQTLIEMSGIMLTEDAQYAQQAIELLKNESMRCYRIEVASDSMVELDESAEKQSRIEFLTAASGFLEKAVQAVQVVPEIAPLMGEMLMFGVRAFKASRPIEAAFEQAVQKLNAPQAPKPDPEQMKVQAQMQLEQVKLQATTQGKQAELQANMQAKQAEMQSNAQMEQMKANLAAQAAEAQRNQEMALEQQRMQLQAEVDRNRQASEAAQHAMQVRNDAELAQLQAQYSDQQHQRDMDFQKWKAELDAATKIEVANISSKAKVDDAATQASTAEVARELAPARDDELHKKLDGLVSTVKEMGDQMNEPATVVRGTDGKVTGVQRGKKVRNVSRDETGRLSGLQ